MHVFEKLRIGIYNNKLPYPHFKNKEAIKEYRAEIFSLENKFKEDLFAEYGVENNPKRELLYSKAWELGHSSGLNEVAIHFSDLVDLIQ